MAKLRLLSAASMAADCFGEGGKGYTPLLIATARVLPDLVDALLAGGAYPNLRSETRAPIFNALSNENPLGRKRMVASLIEHGVKLDVKDADGKTPLMNAVLRADKETTALILAHKADVSAVAKDGSTALHYAVGYNHPGIVELLLANKADPNVRDNNGRTPLDLTRNSVYPPPTALPMITPALEGSATSKPESRAASIAAATP